MEDGQHGRAGHSALELVGEESLYQRGTALTLRKKVLLASRANFLILQENVIWIYTFFSAIIA